MKHLPTILILLLLGVVLAIALGTSFLSNPESFLSILSMILVLIGIASSIELLPFRRQLRLVASRRKNGECETCGYDLRAISHTHCPECGTYMDRV